MDLALGVSKSITDFLQHNEKRFDTYQKQQEEHSKLIEGFKARLEGLERTCQDLSGKNTTLTDELEEMKKREENTTRNLKIIKEDLEKLQPQVEDCSHWVRLMAALTEQVANLNQYRGSIDQELKRMKTTQVKLIEHIDRQQKQIVETAATAKHAIDAISSPPHHNIPQAHNGVRYPTMSPSSSYLFNSSFHKAHPQTRSPTPNRQKQTHPYAMDHNLNHHQHIPEYYISPEPNLDELNKASEDLLRGLETFKESFERSSICSND